MFEGHVEIFVYVGLWWKERGRMGKSFETYQ